MLLWILLIVLLVFALGGGVGYSRWGAVGWSPAGVVLLIVVVLLLTGNLHLR